MTAVQSDILTRIEHVQAELVSLAAAVRAMPVDGCAVATPTDPAVRILWGPFSVAYQERECRVGDNAEFKIMAELVAAAGDYRTHRALAEKAWGGPMSSASVRQAVLRLRRRLRAGGLDEVADAVLADVSGHFRLATGEKN